MKKAKLFSALVLSGMFMVSQAQANLVDFDITINFGGGLTSSQQSIFSDAELFWETNLIGYLEPVTFTPGLTINATGQAIDGVGGVLGSAGPSTGWQFGSLLYAATGNMNFDSADLTNMENNGTLYSVIVHELAHVIGFGTLWELNGLYDPVNGPGQYMGAEALAAYQQEFDANATFVPVELDGGPGTAGGHWDETWAGPTSDIMTGYIEGATTFSDTSFASFRDLGYATLNQQSSPATNVSAPIFGALSLFGLILMGRRFKK